MIGIFGVANFIIGLSTHGFTVITGPRPNISHHKNILKFFRKFGVKKKKKNAIKTIAHRTIKNVNI